MSKYSKLSKEDRKKIKAIYLEEYQNSDFQKRLNRLLIYSIVACIFAIFLIVYSVITKEDVVSNLLIAIPLIMAAIIFLVGRNYAKNNVLKNIATRKKK